MSVVGARAAFAAPFAAAVLCGPLDRADRGDTGPEPPRFFPNPVSVLRGSEVGAGLGATAPILRHDAAGVPHLLLHAYSHGQTVVRPGGVALLTGTVGSADVDVFGVAAVIAQPEQPMASALAWDASWFAVASLDSGGDAVDVVHVFDSPGSPPGGPLVADDAWMTLMSAYPFELFSVGLASAPPGSLEHDGEALVVANALAGSIRVFPLTTGPVAYDAPIAVVESAWLRRADAPPEFADLNGDGILDLIVGAPTFSTGAWENEGAVFVLPGPLPNGVLTLEDGGYVSAPGQYKAQYGASLATGDVDGDGRSDLVVAAPYDSLGQDRAGTVAMVALSMGGTGAWVDLARIQFHEQFAGGGMRVAVEDGPSGSLARIAVGRPIAGTVHVFQDIDEGTWRANDVESDVYTSLTEDGFGASVVFLPGDSGTTLLGVGAPDSPAGAPEAGAVFLFSLR